MAEQVVRNIGELAAAVADMTIDIIIFGDDIELTAPIIIPYNKPSLTFNGMYDGAIHTFTDMNSNLIGDTLNIGWESNISLTFQNMNMIGRNYYGIPYIYEVGTSNVTVTYRNITYVGPQLAFNVQGLTRFENVDITISSSTASRAEEVGEVCRVEFFGENTIRHNSETNAVFWFRNNPAHFTLLPDAKLTVDTVNYFMHNSAGIVPYPVAYEIQQGASFILNSDHGISYDAINYASSFIVGTGASFRYIQSAPNGTTPSLYITGNFTVAHDANVYMQADFANAQPLIYCASGTGALLTLNNPKSFVLYNRVSAPVAVLVSRSYSITTEQLNHWTAARGFPDAGTFIDTPQNKWNNSNWAVFTVNGTISLLSTSATGTGLVGPQPLLTNFRFQNARVISAGALTIIPDPVIDNGRPITGVTEPNANVRVSFTIGSTPYLFDSTADEDGKFEIDPEMQLPIGTVINIRVNIPFLIKSMETTVVATGEITIIRAPERIVFTVPPISTNPVLLRRSDTTEAVEIYDSRAYLTQWELLASISGPLESAAGEVLENAVVFRDNNETLWDLSETPIVVHTGAPRPGQTDVDWPEDKGILVRVTQPIHSGVEYSTRLIWTLNAIEDP